MIFPALTTSGAPFVRIVSCNPLEVPGPGVAPGLSGLAQADPRVVGRRSGPSSSARIATCGRRSTTGSSSRAPPRCPDLEFMPRDNAANLYVFPEEADYVADRPLDDSGTASTRACARTEDELRAARPPLADRPDDSALVYLSLGSLGGADVELMQRLVDALADEPAPLRRQQGSAGRPDRRSPTTCRARQTLPQTTVHPAGRPRDHPRRQQHHHRVAALRQADGPAAAVLGPVRQRAADGRARLRGAAGDTYASHARRAARRRSTGCSADRGPAQLDGRDGRAASVPGTASPGARTSSSRSVSRTWGTGRHDTGRAARRRSPHAPWPSLLPAAPVDDDAAPAAPGTTAGRPAPGARPVAGGRRRRATTDLTPCRCSPPTWRGFAVPDPARGLPTRRSQRSRPGADARAASS